VAVVVEVDLLARVVLLLYITKAISTKDKNHAIIYYWSNPVSGTYSRELCFASSEGRMNNRNRADGNAVRCIKD